MIQTFALDRLDARQTANSLRFLRSQTRCDTAMRHQKIMRDIQSVAQRSIHGLNMIGLFPHHLRAQRLRLRRIHLETLARGRASADAAFLSR